MTAKAPPRLTYLIVEDNDYHVRIIESCFEFGKPADQHIRRVRNGADCLKYLAGEEPFADRSRYPYPDVVLMDIRMPGALDGLQTLAAIRDDPRYRWLFVVMLTSSDGDLDVNRAYQLGANGYLVKSSDTKEMVKKLLDLQWSLTSLLHLFEEKQMLVPEPCLP